MGFDVVEDVEVMLDQSDLCHFEVVADAVGAAVSSGLRGSHIRSRTNQS